MKWSKQEENDIEEYMKYDVEELDNLLKYPNDIETGCKRNCDDCKEHELKLIKEAIERKELAREHQENDL